MKKWYDEEYKFDIEVVGYLRGDGKYSKTIVCPDGCVIFRMTAAPTENPNCLREHMFG